MKELNVKVLGIMAAIGVSCLIVIMSYISNANYGNFSEVTIEKEYENLKNILSQYSLKVSEAAQVPSMYKDDMKEVMTAVMTARVGSAGSKAMFQWFKEHQINIDSAMYTKIQTLIEVGRNQYQNAQSRFLDVKAVYVANLGYVWKGMWLRAAGYPKINVGYPRGTADDYPIIKSTFAVNAFESGTDTGIKLR